MDREKVIKGLECCLTLDSSCGDCPYYSYEDIQELDCERNLRHDALALLKEQEAAKPRSVSRHGAYPQIQHYCGNCNAFLPRKQKYCSECGQAVNWK